MTVLETRVKNLNPHTKVAPFVNKKSKHWLDDYEGESTDHEDLLGFCKDTLFTANPNAFHKALEQAEAAKNDLVHVTKTFPFLAEPAAISAANKVLEAAAVTNLECQSLGTLSALLPKPVKLKREMQRLYDSTPGPIWLKLHPTVQDIITKFAPTAAKKPKVD